VASRGREGLINLKLDNPNMTALTTFFTCFLKVTLESKKMPRYLKLDPTFRFSPLTRTARWEESMDFLEKYIQKVLSSI
jgi:hypothetical protein